MPRAFGKFKNISCGINLIWNWFLSLSVIIRFLSISILFMRKISFNGKCCQWWDSSSCHACSNCVLVINFLFFVFIEFSVWIGNNFHLHCSSSLIYVSNIQYVFGQNCLGLSLPRSTLHFIHRFVSVSASILFRCTLIGVISGSHLSFIGVWRSACSSVVNEMISNEFLLI